ncbi:MAG: MFS transporter [Chloroflexi bacterium]|nr:MFS transporter [Chloroflexota bacterium]MDA1218838.1 MFS transporter [Chloroflexota bacterium]
MWLINFSTMATGNLNFGLFVLPMGQALGMSRSQFGWMQTTRRVSASFSSFLIGRLIDRYGPRFLIVAAAPLIGICLLLVSRTTAPWQVILLFGVIGVSGMAAPNGIVTTVPVAKWFRRNRGKALAVAATGLGVGGVILLPVTQWLIDWLGWRGAWVVLAIIFMSLSMPIAALFLRRQPEDMGLTVDGDPVSRATTVSTTHPEPDTPEVQWTVKEALHTGALWKLMVVFGISGLAQGGASVHRIPYWIERGFDPQVVSFAFASDAAGAATMVLIAGWLADRFPIRFIATASFLGFVAAILLMIVGFNEYLLFASTITFGLSVGAGMIVHSYIIAAYYGRAFLGSIRGIILPINLISAGVGAPLVGYLRDWLDSYILAWWLILGLYLLAAVVMVTITPPQRGELAAEIAETNSS